MKDAESYLGEIVFPIKIPTPFAVGPVYSYLLKDEKIVLVDCGQFEEPAHDKVKRALQEQGLYLKDLDEIWLTHGHPDHFGQAASFAEKSAATVYAHPKGRSNFAGNNDRELFADFFNRHSIPNDAIQRMVEQLDWLQQFQLPITPQWISDGDTLSSGRMQFTVKHTPGHAAGHLVFVEENGLIFGGDLLLEHITTNALINFDPDTEQRNKSLLQYRNSLEWLKSPNGYLLPGHGKFIYDIGQVIEHHLAEHESRYEELKQIIAKHPRSLLQLSLRMFPEAMKRGDAFLVFSEVMGYLDWGMQADEIAEERSEFQLFYNLAD